MKKVPVMLTSQNRLLPMETQEAKSANSRHFRGTMAARAMIVVCACTMTIVHARTMNILHACTMFMGDVPYPTELVFRQIVQGV